MSDAERMDQRPSDESREVPAQNRGPQAAGAFAAFRRHPVRTGLGLGVVVAVTAAVEIWYAHARSYASSDDAFIDGRPVYVYLQVSGVIQEVPVTDNEVVKTGDLLVRIDARDYQAAVDVTNAQILQAEAGVAGVSAQIFEQAATIDQVGRTVIDARAALDFSQRENARYQDLVAKGSGTTQRAEQSAADLQSKQALLSAAQFGQSGAERQALVLEAQRKSAKAQLAAAKAGKSAADANLGRVELRATTEGRITRLTAVPGQLATPGQGVMILVPSEVWVTANFKETELTDIRPGQKAEICIDAYGRTFPGHVDSIQAGSGTVFSLLPAENATGNYVKVVQRIPVKIVFDGQPDAMLALGMSVVPTITLK